ncbi:MAG: cupin domain-containing protein [Sphingomonadaceae bacterium]
MAYFWHAEDRRTVDALPGIRRTLVTAGERVMAVRFELAKGSVLPAHSHPHEQIGFVASGQLRFDIAGEAMLLKAGDGYAVPPNAVHSVEVIEDAVAIDVFTPVRAEYLE